MGAALEQPAAARTGPAQDLAGLPAHRDSLRDFLSLRGFLRETVDVANLGDSGVGEPVADDAAAADPVAGDGGPGAPA